MESTKAYSFMISDPDGACQPLRILVAATSERKAKRAIRGKGFRVPVREHPMPVVPADMAHMALVSPGVVWSRLETGDDSLPWKMHQ